MHEPCKYSFKEIISTNILDFKISYVAINLLQVRKLLIIITLHVIIKLTRSFTFLSNE